jgi:hypothetical protein
MSSDSGLARPHSSPGSGVSYPGVLPIIFLEVSRWYKK